jgi:hypothetical protein
MNTVNKLNCPNCNFEINLDQALSKQIEADLRGKLAEEVNKKNLELKQREAELIKKGQDLESELKERMDSEKKQLWVIALKEAEKKYQENSAQKIKLLESELEERTKKQRELEVRELEFAKKARELEEQKRTLELDFERKFLEKAKTIEDQARVKAIEEADLKLREKDMQFEQLKKANEEMRRKIEQGSMQVQGDTQENQLKEILTLAFPIDLIDDVPTGIKGADLIQKVKSEFGQDCGTIIWESKNTKAWSQEWIRKLKEDQSQAKSDIAILVTKTMPEGVTGCQNIEGVWVVELKLALYIARVLRSNLIQLHKMKQSLTGTDEKMEALHQYLTGNQFKNRIENIVLAFSSMQEDLDKEKRLFQKQWAKREKEIERVTSNTIGLYGDLQGLMGNSLQTVSALELEGPDDLD